MQIILTEEEYKELVPVSKAEDLQNECKKAFEIIKDCYLLPCQQKLRHRRYDCKDCALENLRNVCTKRREYSK